MWEKLRAFLLTNQTARQIIAKNVFWLSVSNIGSRLIRAAIIIYAARLLGAAEYGVFSYALGLAGFFTIFVDVGISSILTREVAKKPERASHFFSTTFWMKSVLLFGTTFLILFVAPYFSNIDAARVLLPLVALLVIFDNLREFSNAFFRAKEKMEYEALVTTAMNVAITVFGFVALAIAVNAHSLMIAYVGSAGAGFFAAALLLREEFARIFRSFDRTLIRPVLRSAWPIALMGLLGAMSLNVDIIMLGWFRTPEEIGFYSAGQKIVQVLYTFPAIVASALLPLLSRLVGIQDKIKFRLLTEKGLALVFAVAFPLAVGGIVLAQPIIGFLYGSEYLPGASAFQILIMTVLVVFPGTILGNIVFAHDKQKKIAGYIGVTSIGNVVLNVILIPPFGIVGAAVATIVSQAFFNGLMWRFVKRLAPFAVGRHLVKMGIATFIMGLIAFALSAAGVHVLATITIAALSYFAILAVLKERILAEARDILNVAKNGSS
ncbi:MAG: flippase [Candidatus Jorgensenbacteria bacterium]|nr:flippase [Candidatus Jorgensenbacteria bacterium]